MALLSFLPENTTKGPKKQREPPSTSKHRKKHRTTTTQQPSSSSWDQIKNLLSCKQVEGSKIHDPSKPNTNNIGSSCGSICSFRDVVHGNTRVVHRADNSPEGSTVGQDTALLVKKRGTASGRAGPVQGRSNGGSGHSTAPSSRAMQFRKLSGCYECRMIVDPSRYPCPRSSLSVCSQCGEVFPKVESLELHQAVRHAVSELGQEDSGRNIVEIIFKSSWLKKDNPICVIERILKVHNTQRTIQRFEECRDAVKTRALTSGARKNPRCAADGNELLRFHCTTLSCSLGADGSSSLCSAVPGCGVCSIIRYGGKAAVTAAAADKGFKGVRTTASSGRAHDSLRCGDGRRAVLVCRVIAGRVRRVSADQAPANSEDDGGALPAAGYFDSVASEVGAYSNLEELIVFNPKAILPCFVVIYRAVGC